MSKHARGHTFSIVDMVSAIFAFNVSTILGSITFEQIFLNTRLRLIRNILVSFGIKVQRQRGKFVASLYDSHGILDLLASYPYEPYFSRMPHNLLEFSIYLWFVGRQYFLHLSSHRV